MNKRVAYLIIGALGRRIVEYLAAFLPTAVNRNCEGAASVIQEHPASGCLVDLGLGERDTRAEFSKAALERILELLKSAGTLEGLARAKFYNSTVARRYAEQYDHLQNFTK